MGNEGSRRVVERVADVIDRIGDAQDDAASAEPATESGADQSETATDRSDEVTAVTDGGADEASPGNGTWSADDPITFDDESEEDPGTAILEAVTEEDESTSPFDDLGDDAGGDGDAVSEDRLDELEARIGALESDHVALESQLDDVANAIAELGGDVDRIGDDVLELVTLFGAVALATDRPAESSLDPADVAAEIASELDGRTDAAPDGTDRRVGDGSENSASAATASEAERATSTEQSVDHRSDSGQAASTGADDPNRRDETRQNETRRDEARRDATRQGETQADASEGNAGDPSRSLVDPRTDAVGARLRQFREGFVDDPTEDLPTGSSADDFRFEKVLLPTDGEDAPDLSTEELEKPYLEALPDGYAADAVVLEWLDWLVSAGDGETAARAIRYYESIDWLTEDAREALLGYLDGLGDPGAVDGSTPVHEPPAALDLQDHLRSLQYVTELATGEVDADGI